MGGGVAKFIARTLVGGVVFLLPIALILFLVGHLFAVIQPPAAQLAHYIGEAEMGPGWLTLLILATLLLTSFLLGLLATTVGGCFVTGRLETVVLNQVPGYSIIKSAAADAAASIAAIDQGD